MEERLSTDAAHLARLGFRSPRAADLLAHLPITPEVIASAADPDQALAIIAQIQIPPAYLKDESLLSRLVAVTGASRELGEFLSRHPEALGDLVKPIDDISSRISLPVDGSETSLERLRVDYRRVLLSIAAADLSGSATFPEIAGALSHAADLVLDRALVFAREKHPQESAEVDLAVIAMGKCGGNELNYISDVDVIFVVEPTEGVSNETAIKSGTTLSQTLMRACSDLTSEGSIWPVDAALRPEGRDGPLVRTVDSHLEYYKKWAKTWEFQALLKARFAAGDRELGQRYLDALMPLVWTAADREGFVVDVQAMRRRVEDHIPENEAPRQLKLGVGGLRDVEFAVQLLQLVHGKADEQLRTGNTLAALSALSDGGFVGREDAEALASAYVWLRTVEHRIQLHRLRRTHLMPESEEDLRRLGRSLGYRIDPIEQLQAEWRDRATLIRRIHEKLFYRPLLMAVAKLGADEQRLTPEAARRRLMALGYVDPNGALAHLTALTSGLQRRAAIQKALLPAMLGWFADGPNPDAGLLGFRQLSDALGDTPWYLRTLRDSGVAAQRLAFLLSTSRYTTELLLRAPEAAAMLEDDTHFVPRGRKALIAEALSVAQRQDDPEAAIEAVRAVRRRELFRTAVADLLHLIDVEQVGEALSDVAGATLAAALDASIRSVAQQSPIPTKIAIIAMGRLGGGEMSYPSDADVLFIHEPYAGFSETEATSFAMGVAAKVRELCALPTPEPPLLVDADLRPEGRDGPLVRTLDSYRAYYDQWAEVWERQALLRATPLAGDAELGQRFIAMIAPYRFAADGIASNDLREIRRIKARVESERLPRGADPARHVKLGPGGLSDVEWLAQLLQLQWSHQHPELKSPRTLEVLRSAELAGLMASSDRDALIEAWVFATKIRDAIMLVRAKPGDELPRDARDLRAVAFVLGYEHGGALVDQWQRVSRRARAAFVRLFFGA